MVGDDRSQGSVDVQGESTWGGEDGVSITNSDKEWRCLMRTSKLTTAGEYDWTTTTQKSILID